MTGNRVDRCVEIMCQKGCRTLWADIEALQKGVSLPEVDSLSVAERQQVLLELKTIMAVYESTGSCNVD